ncbi:hypothetical protein Dda_2621 [Drechslerella dactyloides]|uniref:Uncharacterized protein n=1 Tax=Drechslerella dactyloides TaxID=74499 RepID=A0AAD6J481_DREDA|nr:hypothetical protein Dda_2621 [Drechslerella dactyloides]
MATTLLNLPPSTPSNNDNNSDPGTPASGISTLSTTAIKDGHEGHHPHPNLAVAAERVSRLGGIGAPPPQSDIPRDYFETAPYVPHTPGTASVISSLADEHGSLEGEASGANSTQAKRESMAAVLARRQLEQQQMLNANAAANANPPTSVPSIMTNANNVNASNHVSTIGPAVSPVPRASNAPDGAAAAMYNHTASRSTDSPASTMTTPSVAEARVDAKLIDGMTYDEGDTTAEGLGRRDTIRPGQIPPGLNRDDDTPME